MIPGLTYLSDFVSDEEQENLIKFIDSQPWIADLKRRTQHYGYKYDYTRKAIDANSYVGPIPKEFQFLANRLLDKNYFDKTPDQIIINEYLPGQGISRHVDCITCFEDIIASISLNSTCVMQFENWKDSKSESIFLQPKSLLVLANEARYNWMHSIPAKREDDWNGEKISRQRRISLTFRKVLLSN